jgi:C-terminal processing protease CtpA/Prc
VGQRLIDSLPIFTPGVGSLSWGERFDILDAWVSVLDGLYAHLPLKRALYGFDPIRALEHLRQQVPSLSDLQFHRELTSLINRLRDAHTQYTGPKRWADAVASLPFLVEAFGPIERPSYVVTKVSRRRVGDEYFVPGVTLEWWNGVPFDRAVDLHADVETGGRPDARRARALESMTFRAFGYGPPPDEMWVVIGYRDLTDRAREVTFEWHVVDPGRAPTASITRASRVRRAINPAAEAVRRAKKLMFNFDLWKSERRPAAAARAKSKAAAYQDFLTARQIPTPDGPIGYLRIWSFDVDDDQGFLDAAIALLRDLPDRGLIIDLRDNPGGFIWAAERMLQLFTPAPISPTKFALRATPLTIEMASAAFNQEELGPWAASLTDASQTGEPYSSHLPITTVDQCNDLGQHYGGPIVVIVDANTYSSGDLFTAGIVDNRIGPVVCIGEATGAGGANVWTSDDVQSAMLAAKRPLPELPAGTGFTLAVRRAVRSGDADGTLIEDSGISGQPYEMTQRDVLSRNEDLLAHCAKLLAAQPWTRLKIEMQRGTVVATTAGLDQLDLFGDGHPVGSTIHVRRDGTRRLRVAQSTRQLDVVGYSRGIVCQRRRITLATK